MENRNSPRGVFASLFVAAAGGCQLDEVRGTHAFGVEYRHTGEGRTEHERYSVQPGVELQWSNDVETGVSYRRRDDNDGLGNHDDGVFFDVSIPLWRRDKERDPRDARIAELERRISALESRVTAPAEQPASEPQQ